MTFVEFDSLRMYRAKLRPSLAQNFDRQTEEQRRNDAADDDIGLARLETQAPAAAIRTPALAITSLCEHSKYQGSSR
ncbi:hypothetical protein [Sphingopyxis sp.]|uniref:hypothetical protein n=1 Tax=Sphingopyxis sp. TaxID=1908224 RepID=UPI002D79FD23|nr:hypothetical protein [Sphingopyxis sp.]HET6526993.1 hypothetical protein [Sphingopyxis sp.]